MVQSDLSGDLNALQNAINALDDLAGQIGKIKANYPVRTPNIGQIPTSWANQAVVFSEAEDLAGDYAKKAQAVLSGLDTYSSSVTLLSKVLSDIKAQYDKANDETTMDAATVKRIVDQDSAATGVTLPTTAAS
jgi:hypothetical protein